MKQKFYHYKADTESLFFEFTSVSEEKTISKIITYSPLPDDPEIYNLALGDILLNGEVSDLTVSNNSDMEKVIATVVRTIFNFFEKHPENAIYFKGSSPERTRLYRIIISKELNEAQKLFNFYGIINGNLEYFSQNRPYQAFIITLKDDNNL